MHALVVDIFMLQGVQRHLVMVEETLAYED